MKVVLGTARVMIFEHFGGQFFEEQNYFKNFYFSGYKGPLKLYCKVNTKVEYILLFPI